MTELRDRITVNFEHCGGQPCIRGMRIRVVDILDLLASGLSAQQVVEELPDLEIADVTAALRYAARRDDDLAVTADQPRQKTGGSLLAKLQKIKIEGPEDFSANIDLYLAGEKKITDGEVD